MADFFLLLWIATSFALVIGLIRPESMVFWSDKKTRDRAALVYGLAMIGSLAGFSLAVYSAARSSAC